MLKSRGYRWVRDWGYLAFSKLKAIIMATLEACLINLKLNIQCWFIQCYFNIFTLHLYSQGLCTYEGTILVHIVQGEDRTIGTLKANPSADVQLYIKIESSTTISILPRNSQALQSNLR